MYAPKTVLRLKQPKSTDDTPFAYDEVEVVGASPLNHAAIDSEWTNATNGQGVIIRPLTEFDRTLDEPYGRIQELYDVVSVPETVTPTPRDIKVIDSASASAGPTPEEVFAAETGEQPRRPKPVKKRSPLVS